MIAKRHTIANALRVAADQYKRDSETMGALVNDQHPGIARLVEQFAGQAVLAASLAAAVEQADAIELED